MNTLFPNAVVDEDVELEYFAIEAQPETPGGRFELVAVVADVDAEMALKAVRQSRVGAFFAGRGLMARPVACPGLANPLAIEGWSHYDGPSANGRGDGKAMCPACRRTLAVVEPGMRWSIRLVDRAPAGTEKGHGIHTCQRSECRQNMEIVVSQTPKGGNR